MKKLALLASFASCAFAAQASPIGELQDVSGAVSVSGKGVVSRAANGTKVADGASILVSSSGQATLALNSGCVVTLGANQHITVDAKMPCEAVSASVKHLFPAYKVAQAPIGSGLPVVAPPAAAATGAGGAAGGFSALASAGIGLTAFVGGVIAVDNATGNPVSGQ